MVRNLLLVWLSIVTLNLHADASVDGSVVTFPNDGDRWKVYDLSSRRNVCLSWQDGVTCVVSPGRYSIINVTRNTRKTIVVEDSSESEFEFDVIADNLNQPVAIVPLGLDSLLVGEKGGKIVLISSINGNSLKSTYLQIPNVDKQGEKGLLSIALDPQFNQNNYFYVFYQNSAANRARVSRFTSQGIVSDIASETLIWEDNISLSSQTDTDHWGGGLAFGPDGYLYLSIGDKKDRPSDAQDLTLSAGKILRLDTSLIDLLGEWERGTENLHIIPFDNPYVDGLGGNLDEIWGLGLRNPYRIYWDNNMDTLYIADVGGNIQQGPNASHEDIHVATSADAGANFGWPQCEGPSCSGTPPLNYSAPKFSIKHVDARAIIGGVVYSGKRFPIKFTGAYFYTDYTKGWLRYIKLDANRNLAPRTPPGGNVFAGNGVLGRPVSVIEGANGELFYVDIIGINATGGGRVGRIAYSGGVNLAPQIISVAVNPVNSQSAPANVAFDVVATDPEESVLQYSWDFGDGNTGFGASTNHIYSVAGSYQVRVTVSDGERTQSSSETTVVVGAPALVSIDSELDGLLFRAGDIITLRGDAQDSGTMLEESNFLWTVSFLHDEHKHPVLTDVAGTSCMPAGSSCLDFTIPSTGHDFTGSTAFEVTLKVVDSDGLVSTDTAVMYPDKVEISVTTNLPEGIDILVDEIPNETPLTLDSLIGFTHVFDAPNQVNQSGSRYVFSGWQTGEADRLLTVQVPEQSTVFQANYSEIEVIGTELIGGVLLSGNTFTFPDDGNRWKLYDRVARRNVCLSWKDGLTCTAVAGDYSVINVTSNKRQSVFLTDIVSPVVPVVPQEGAVVDGRVVTFPDDGDRWKVYDRVKRVNVCRSWVDGFVCTVKPGKHSVINVTKNTRKSIVVR